MKCMCKCTDSTVLQLSTKSKYLGLNTLKHITRGHFCVTLDEIVLFLGLYN
jgi:hypothetical protein